MRSSRAFRCLRRSRRRSSRYSSHRSNQPRNHLTLCLAWTGRHLVHPLGLDDHQQRSAHSGALLLGQEQQPPPRPTVMAHGPTQRSPPTRVRHCRRRCARDARPRRDKAMGAAVGRSGAAERTSAWSRSAVAGVARCTTLVRPVESVGVRSAFGGETGRALSVSGLPSPLELGLGLG
jgi:hypothetical protein